MADAGVRMGLHRELAVEFLIRIFGGKKIGSKNI
jgi:pyrroline-5-carboxylate reductase